MILDSHVHNWDASRYDLRWTRKLPRLQRSHDAEEYRTEADAAGIGGCVLVEVDVPAPQRREEADDQVARCAAGRGGAIAAVPCIDPHDPDFAAIARDFAAMPAVRAVRWLPRTDADTARFAASPTVRANLALLGELGLAFDLNVPVSSLHLLPAVVAACPRTRFVLDHFGYADPVAFGARADRAATHDAASWRRDIDALAAQPNASCKVSGLANRLPAGGVTADAIAPIVEHARTAFGSPRLLFGSDWPVIGPAGTLVAWVAALREVTASWPATDREQLFGGAARRWYALGHGAAKSGS